MSSKIKEVLIGSRAVDPRAVDPRAIDPRAVISPDAEIGEGVKIGPYTTIGKNVKIGDGTVIGPNAFIGDNVTLGKDNKIFQFASIGAPPQDISYGGEDSYTIIGDNNTFREFTTVHGGTEKDTSETVIGSNCLFMNYTHAAHDCKFGDNVILANGANIGGHVHIGDRAVVGGVTAVHQYVHIGVGAMIGGCSAVSKDVAPYVLAVGNRAIVRGLNIVGLKRGGLNPESRKAVKEAFRIIFKMGLTKEELIEKLKNDIKDEGVCSTYVDFIENSTRGLAKVKDKTNTGSDMDMD